MAEYNFRLFIIQQTTTTRNNFKKVNFLFNMRVLKNKTVLSYKNIPLFLSKLYQKKALHSLCLTQFYVQKIYKKYIKGKIKKDGFYTNNC